MCFLNAGYSAKPKTRTIEIFITQCDFAYVVQKPAGILTSLLLLYYIHTKAHLQ